MGPKLLSARPPQRQPGPAGRAGAAWLLAVTAAITAEVVFIFTATGAAMVTIILAAARTARRQSAAREGSQPSGPGAE